MDTNENSIACEIKKFKKRPIFRRISELGISGRLKTFLISKK